MRTFLFRLLFFPHISWMNILKEHSVPEGIKPSRLSDYATVAFQAIIPSRKGIKKAIKKGAILVDGQVGQTGTWLYGGEKLCFVEVDLPSGKVLDLDLKAVYEDEFLAVINKPGGIPVSGNQFWTIQNALLNNLTASEQIDGLRLPRPVHRLDAPTCGLLVIAKTAKAQRDLHRQFEEKTIQKKYQALVIGRLEQKGIIEKKIEDKPARTLFFPLKNARSIRNKFITLIELQPVTGRTHQLRIHMSGLGFPILGDKQYGQKGMIKRGKGLFLCATQLVLQHPVFEQSIDISIVPPPKFELTLQREQRMWERLNQ